MDSKIKYALQNFLASRKDLFGEGNLFLCFNEDKSSRRKGIYDNVSFGRILFYQKDGETCLSKSLALKIQREIGVFENYEISAISNEVFFYSKVIPFFDDIRHIEHMFPRFYGNYTETVVTGVRSVTIMENIRTEGYEQARKKIFLDYEHLALMARKLGELHAYSFQKKKLDCQRFRCLVESFGDNNSKLILGYLGELDNWLRPILKLVGDDLWYSSNVNDDDEFIARVKKGLLESMKNDQVDKTLVLCHGAYCGTNMLFKYENEKPVDGKIIDMANCVYSSAALDLAWLLYSSADQKTRRVCWNDLIDEYYTALSGTFSDCEIPSRDAIVEEMKKKLIFAGIHASVYISFVTVVEKENSNLLNMTLSKMIKMGNRADPKIRIQILKDIIDRGGI